MNNEQENINSKKYNQPTTIVIFGGTGDLAKTKLLPALLDLYIQKALPDSFTIIALSRKEMTDKEYQDFVCNNIEKKDHRNQKSIDDFCEHLHYVSGNFDESIAYEKIKEALQKYDDSIKQCTSKLFYLAVPPNFYSQIFLRLKESNAMALCDRIGSWSRLLVEKPFGRDLETAQKLEKQLSEFFSEDQIYRIDHYLEKDAIENIISLRFANSVFTDSWNKNYIESIELRLLESKDVSNRGSFFDDIGNLRDVGQNHILQMLALLTMHNVDVNSAKSVHEGRSQALQYFSHQEPKKIIRGQYNGFTETKGVDPNSQTETYFKIETELSTDKWKGVNFIIESGKALNRSITEAIITFREINECSCGFEAYPHKHKNILKITFSPEQLMTLTIWVKKPGFDFTLEPRILELTNKENKDTRSPEAYERVLFDCIIGDQTRFVSGNEITAAWEFITPILEKFKTLPLYKYELGSTGPTE